MEAFQVPISALVTICAGLTVLAIAVTDSGLLEKGEVKTISTDPAYTTQSERMLRRYIKAPTQSYLKLKEELSIFMGESTPYMLLIVVDASIEDASSKKLDTFYCLRGMILKDMGRVIEAMESFQKALDFNHDNIEARLELIEGYMNWRAFDFTNTYRQEPANETYDEIAATFQKREM